MVARATAAKYASLRRKVLGWRGKWPDVGKNMHKTNLTDGFGCWESLTSVKCLGIVKAVASPNNQLPMRRGDVESCVPGWATKVHRRTHVSGVTSRRRRVHDVLASPIPIPAVLN